LAAFIDGPATVRLRVPPPLGVEMTVEEGAGGVALVHGDVMVAQARPDEVELTAPDPPTFELAEAARERFRGFHSHWFPTCFVCGPERREGDGLRIFAGELEGQPRVACPWIPDASLATAGDVVAAEFLWAALDCPGGFAFAMPEEGAILLGELSVALHGTVSVGERCIVMGWEIGRDGRKHYTGTALFGESGECRGVGRATWIEVPEQ